jgi:hypothetical protein
MILYLALALAFASGFISGYGYRGNPEPAARPGERE